MSKAHLESAAEIEILQLIEANEAQSIKDSKVIESSYYLQLADIYHADKKYHHEYDILSRYVTLDNANKDEFVDIYLRIDRISQIKEMIAASQSSAEVEGADEQSSQLKLQSSFDGDEEITLFSSPTKREGRLPDQAIQGEKPLLVLTVCSVFTGREIRDEVIQLALVLFEYDPRQDKKARVIEKYSARRKTRKPISDGKMNKFHLEKHLEINSHFDNPKIVDLFLQADLVVSHNDAEVERKLLSLLIPEISSSRWYSSQKDIPWGALGFNNKSLSQLALSLGEKAPRSAMERALTIYRILQKDEPCHTQTYLDRLYNAKPMKPFEWTPELIKQHHRLERGFRFYLTPIIIFSCVIGAYYWFINH